MEKGKGGFGNIEWGGDGKAGFVYVPNNLP
jgi:hypothetical protein